MPWKTVFVQTDIHDPETGEPLYCYASVRPHWYWVYRRVCLFLSIVWRVWDVRPDGSKYRISIRTAWSVSEVAMGLE